MQEGRHVQLAGPTCNTYSFASCPTAVVFDNDDHVQHVECADHRDKEITGASYVLAPRSRYTLTEYENLL